MLPLVYPFHNASYHSAYDADHDYSPADAGDPYDPRRHCWSTVVRANAFIILAAFLAALAPVVADREHAGL